MAEGFSASILPSREGEDVDALPNAQPRGRTLTVTMRNEALETHVVRYVNLLAVAHERGNRVFKTENNTFIEANTLIPPTNARDEGGSILEAVRELDGVERKSVTDSNDLAAKEYLDLTFEPNDTSSYGIVLGTRQAFVSTYLFYQTLGYLARNAAEFAARAELGDSMIRNRSQELRDLTGGIEVLVEAHPGVWESRGEVYEMGPIATDVHIVPLASAREAKHIRLRMAKGSWRIDWLALAKMQRTVHPTTILPSSREHTAIRLFPTPDSSGEGPPRSDGTLITQPGDEYRYSFTLPDQPERYELFLDTRGYYLEWMRPEWLKEENPLRALQMFLDPKRALKTNARGFKAIEAVMEESFWSSKISHSVQ